MLFGFFNIGFFNLCFFSQTMANNNGILEIIKIQQPYLFSSYRNAKFIYTIFEKIYLGAAKIISKLAQIIDCMSYIREFAFFI